METNPSEMNMETADVSPTECHEKFITYSKEERELSETSLDDKIIEPMEMDFDNDEDDDNSDDNQKYENTDYEDDNDAHTNAYDEQKKQHEALWDLYMIRMAPLFASQPRLEKICKEWENEFLSTGFTQYNFQRNKNDSVDKLHEKTNDLNYLLNLYGTNLTCLNLSAYPSSEIMPIINANCPNLEQLSFGFEKIISQDFENVFSSMSKLETLFIYWHGENLTIPLTLAKSLEQIGGTLKILGLARVLEGNGIFLPDSLAPVFPQLTALNFLTIIGFGLSQLLLQSIGEINNLVDLTFMLGWPENHPMLDTTINMYPIGNLKNLENLNIDCNLYDVTDEFLINLSNNAKNLKSLSIIGTNITDTGMAAINNLEQLELFNLGLDDHFLDRSEINGFITDESIQCLSNQKLVSLDISNCINVTDKSVLKLVENLPSLKDLSIENTKVTREAVEKIYESRKQRNKPIEVHHSFENDDYLFSNH